jgi:hypothetical protein
VRRQDVAETHQLHELEQSRRGVLEPHETPSPPRGKLEPRQRVDADRIRFHAGDVAARDRAGLAENGAHAVAETGKIGAGDGAADGEGDLVRRGCGHCGLDRRDPRNSAVAAELEQGIEEVDRVLKAVE